jgi:hypothetical protein
MVGHILQQKKVKQLKRLKKSERQELRQAA